MGLIEYLILYDDIAFTGYFIESLKLNLFCLVFLMVDYFDL